MDRELTELEKGIVVSIKFEDLDKISKIPGFLPYEHYPEEYKKISLYDEVGRLRTLRFIVERY